MNNLPKVVTQQRRGRASNPRLLDRKSDALPLSHRATPLCLPRSGVVSKRLNVSSYFLQYMVASTKHEYCKKMTTSPNTVNLTRPWTSRIPLETQKRFCRAVSIAQLCRARLCHRICLSVCLDVRPSGRHMLVLCCNYFHYFFHYVLKILRSCRLYDANAQPVCCS